MKAGLRAFFDLDDAKCCNSNVITGCGTSRPARAGADYRATTAAALAPRS
jgi:hypothetical protein